MNYISWWNLNDCAPGLFIDYFIYSYSTFFPIILPISRSLLLGAREDNKPFGYDLQIFGSYLAGLIEGDGWFGDKVLHIIFAENDISLAYLIKNRIGHGNVYKIKDKKAVRYICKNTKGLSLILSLINGKICSNLKYDQLIKHNYSEHFNIVILPPLKTLSLDNY